MSWKWTKRVTEIGLSLMSEDARRDRIDQIMVEGTMDGKKLAMLIDECKTAVSILLASADDGTIAATASTVNGMLDREEMEEMINAVNGKTAVATTDPDELVSWLMELMG